LSKVADFWQTLACKLLLPIHDTVASPVKPERTAMPRVKTDKEEGKAVIRSLAKKTNIGILLFSGARLAAVHGLTDLFELANHYSAKYGGEHPAKLNISHWDANPDAAQLECVFDPSPHHQSQLDCLIFAPTLEIDQQNEKTDNLLAWRRGNTPPEPSCAPCAVERLCWLASGC
jgi:hypothetical protein